MSYITVMVVTNKPGEAEIKKALIPFQAYSSTSECPIRFHMIEDEEYREILEEWRNGGWRNITMYFNMEKGNYPPTFEEFMREFYKMVLDPETGKYGFWDNRDAKWDSDYEIDDSCDRDMSLEEYRDKLPECIPSAVLMDGQWFEMGIIKEEAEWKEEFETLFLKISSNNFINMVICHDYLVT